MAVLNWFANWSKDYAKIKYPVFVLPRWLVAFVFLFMAASVASAFLFYTHQQSCAEFIEFQPPTEGCTLYDSMLETWRNDFEIPNNQILPYQTNYQAHISGSLPWSPSFNCSRDSVASEMSIGVFFVLASSKRLSMSWSLQNPSKTASINKMRTLSGLPCTFNTSLSSITMRFNHSIGDNEFFDVVPNGPLPNTFTPNCLFPNYSTWIRSAQTEFADMHLALSGACLKYSIDNHLQRCRTCSRLDASSLLILTATALYQLFLVLTFIVRCITKRVNKKLVADGNEAEKVELVLVD